MGSELKWVNVRQAQEERKKRRQERELELERIRRAVVERFVDYGNYSGIELREIGGIGEGFVDFLVRGVGKRIRLYIQEDTFSNMERDKTGRWESMDLILFAKLSRRNNIGIAFRGCEGEEIRRFVKKGRLGRKDEVVVASLPTPNIARALVKEREVA